MREVTRYESTDGVLFLTAAACTQHELRRALVEATVNAILGPPDARINSNGTNYLVHPPGTYALLRHELPELWTRAADDDPVYRGFTYRAACLDTNDCEWGQPYFAQHPTSLAHPLTRRPDARSL